MDDPRLLVGFQTSDDAAVYRLDAQRALVVTADFVTPPVDDGRLFGAIAAANALGDVYAMGGEPLLCLNLVGFPADRLPQETLSDILTGAAEKIAEAGALLVGGHSTEDREPKFGLAVVGLVHPERCWRNAGALPGDALLLTKPIGSGVLFNAHRRGWVSAEAMEACLREVGRLHRRSVEALVGFEVHAATDVTGFGLAGHALEMARASGVTLRISWGSVPVFAEAEAMYRRGVGTGVNAANRSLVEGDWFFTRPPDSVCAELCVDPQTSGGLLLALPWAEREEALQALRDAGAASAACIGQVQPRADAGLIIEGTDG